MTQREDEMMLFGMDDDPPPRLPPTPDQWARTRTALEAIAAGPDATRDLAKSWNVGRPLWSASRHNVWARHELAVEVATAALVSGNDAANEGGQR